MSHLTYASYPEFGTSSLKSTHYSQAVLIPPTGSTLQLSGQGGWDRSSTQSDAKISPDLATEIEQAFENIDVGLKYAGGKGMEQVYKLVAFYAPLTEEALGLTIELLKKWFPNHQPILTAIGIDKLALPGMRVEIEAYAHLG